MPCFLFDLIKVHDERFCWRKSFQYLILLLVTVSILSHLGYCNSRKLQSFWDLPQTSLGGFTVSPAQFLLCKNYKCPLWTFPVQSLGSSKSPELCWKSKKLGCSKLAGAFNMGKTTASNILKYKQRLKKQYEQFHDKSKKRACLGVRQTNRWDMKK